MATEPTAQYTLFEGRVSVFAFGAASGETWRAVNLPEGTVNWDVLLRIPKNCLSGVSLLMIVRPVFGIDITFSRKETQEIRENPAFGIPVYVDKADAVMLCPSEAAWISSADCLTELLFSSQHPYLIACHCGRECLIDRVRIETGKPHRQNESVIQTATRSMSREARKRIRAYGICGIGPFGFEHSMDDPKRGATNRDMIMDTISKWGNSTVVGDAKKGRLSIHELVRSQLIREGVHPHNIGHDVADTMNDKDRDGNPLWYSNRRGDAKRNGILVVRHW